MCKVHVRLMMDHWDIDYLQTLHQLANNPTFQSPCSVKAVEQ